MAGGEFEGLVSMTVLFEAAYVLSSVYNLDRVSIVESIIGVLGLRGISMLKDEREYLDQTLSLYMSIPRLSFADCYHAALSLSHCNGEMYTYDQDFDRVPGITRLEPGT
jgi:predicted nucleic acid-binding protein